MRSRAARRLEREAHKFAVQASMFAECVSVGGPYSEDAARLLKGAARLVLSAARLDAIQDTEE